ncbi:MAG: hypothetical protein GC162_15680 [Planctomycetes bacterium]|nr:hypothetical protein [Planctomycetota bacterium]
MPTLLHRITLTLTLALTLASTGFAQEAAKLAPADASIFVEINDLAALRADWANDPLGQYLQTQLPPNREPQAWSDVQAMMQMTGPQIVDKYFGKVLALVVKGTYGGAPGVVLSKVDKADAAVAIDRLMLQPAGKAGNFDLYVTGDGAAGFAFADEWMAMGEPRNEVFIKDMLANVGKGKSLADDEQFKTWIGKLPQNRQAVAFLRNPDQDEVHAVAAQREHRNLTLTYAGHSPNFAEGLSKLSTARATEFGPLPERTIAAMTINGYDTEPDIRFTELVDRVLAPKTYVKDIMPKLQAPVVLFLGEATAQEMDPSPGFSAPVVGIAIHMRDATVTTDLDKLVNSALLFANLATLEWKVDPIAMSMASHNGKPYSVADIGKSLSQHFNRPGLAGTIKLAYGRVGEWYVITSHETMFKAMLDAAADPGKSLVMQDDFKAMGLEDVDAPIVTGFLRAPRLAAHIQTWIDRGRQMHPEIMAEATHVEPSNRIAKIVRGITVLQGVLKHYTSMTLQMHKTDDEAIGATIKVIRPE